MWANIIAVTSSQPLAYKQAYVYLQSDFSTHFISPLAFPVLGDLRCSESPRISKEGEDTLVKKVIIFISY
jgi:hypothetical protein